MSSKYLTLTFVFEEEFDEDFNEVTLKAAAVERDTNLTSKQINALGDEIAQTDRWQVDNWNTIQWVMGNASITSAELR